MFGFKEILATFVELYFVFFLWVSDVSSVLCFSVLMEVYKVIEDLDFFHNVFKILGLSVDF